MGPPWTIVSIASKGLYQYCKVAEDHPYKNSNGYILHHRVVMENKLGRLLDPEEIVHHINDQKKDNRPENLAVMSRDDHSRLHGYERGKLIVELKCPQCGLIFEKRIGHTHLMREGRLFTACCARCAGEFNSELRHYGLSEEMQKGLDENVQRIYRKWKKGEMEALNEKWDFKQE